MFLAAVLRAGAAQAPVKVRNLSPRGAMLESSLTPPPGTKVDLMRGGLLAEGIITWSSNERCGLRFLSEVSVKQWRTAPATAQQHRVVRAGEAAAAIGNPESRPPQTDKQLRDYVGEVVKLLQDLEEDLVSSSETSTRHAEKLQSLGIAMQMLRAITQQ